MYKREKMNRAVLLKHALRRSFFTFDDLLRSRRGSEFLHFLRDMGPDLRSYLLKTHSEAPSIEFFEKHFKETKEAFNKAY